MFCSNPVQDVAGYPTSNGNGQTLHPVLHIRVGRVIMVKGALDEVLPAMNLTTHYVDEAQCTGSETTLNFGHEFFSTLFMTSAGQDVANWSPRG